MLNVCVASSFTADPLLQPIEFWLKTLEIPAEVSIAPYAQVMQELLDPQSSLSRNKHGVNILVLRLEDWLRDRLFSTVDTDHSEHLERAAADFVSAMGVARARTQATFLVFFGPSSSSLPPHYNRRLEEITQQVTARLALLPNVNSWTHAELGSLYPVAEHLDARADHLGHIPYTTDYFTAIATLLARRIALLSKPQRKVIAIDCDNTLWKGVCAEDGAAGVSLTPFHKELQALLVRQHDAGMLLCLCSKNNPSDVEAVFRTRPDMLLREEHIVSSRINWETKSANLRFLAQELDLALESFILIDDSAMECAEVRANCPGVLCLELPEDPEQATHLLRHAWTLDRTGVTEEAKRRTIQYRENRARKLALEQATDIGQFLASLELHVEISPMSSAQLTRVAELIGRTTQFNLTGSRRRAAEIQTLIDSGELQVLVVCVRDRFGDYGLVGAVCYRLRAESLDVDTFVLSCRVLGRAVEHQIVEELGRIAKHHALPAVLLRYRKTARNVPALRFLTDSFAKFRRSVPEPGEGPSESEFLIPVESTHDLGRVQIPRTLEERDTVERPTPSMPYSGSGWHETALRLSRVSDILQEVGRVSAKSLSIGARQLTPRTAAEAAVAAVWAQVLNVDEFSVQDNFFDLGGDSVQAVRVISRIGAATGLELSLPEFFDAPTVEEIAARLGSAPVTTPAIRPVARQDISAASWAQQRLWFIDQLEGGSTAYHISVWLRLRGDLDGTALQSALDTLLARHESLRTVFVMKEGELQQVIRPPVPFALGIADAQSDAAQSLALRDQIQEEIAARFDLGVGPLARARWWRLPEGEHFLMLTLHHIISDGWSVGVLLRELGALYGSFRNQRAPQLAPLAIQFADYVHWQRQWLTGVALEREVAHWTARLQGAPELLELPLDHPRPAVQSYRGAFVPLSLGPQLTRELKEFSRARSLTLAMTLYAGWFVVLSRLSAQRDIVIGVPIANRQRVELEGLIGFLVNTLAVRTQIGEDARVGDLLDAVRASLLEAYAHQNAPFEKIVEALQPTRSLSYSPVFQAAFVLHNAPRGALDFSGLTALEEASPTQTSHFDITLSLTDSPEGLVGGLNYASDLLDQATVEAWARYLIAALRYLIQDPNAPIMHVQLMSDDERRQVLETFNATRAPFPRDRLIHELYEEQAQQSPEALAIVDQEQSLTYRGLNERANQLACLLLTQGASPGEYIPIHMARSVSQIVAQLAVLKIGATYVPVDPEFPTERRAFIVHDCGARRILGADERRPEWVSQSIQWTDYGEDLPPTVPTVAPKVPPHARLNRPAYLMYTSGSTGTPKGVIVPHHAVNRLALNNGYAQLGAADCVAHCSNPAFDASTFEIWGALLNGARILVVPQTTLLDAPRLTQLLEQHGVTVMFLTVGLFSQYVEALKPIFGQLRYLLTGGDVLDPAIAHRAMRDSPPQQLLNAYGPTECTTFASTYPIDGAEPLSTVPIGRPISNTQIYILDPQRNPVPIGVYGELYIGGDGVALGYLNRPELTAERFITHPFGADPDARLYRTGDLGRWRRDGNIEFVGRNDHQVKVRGFRIELGEIEARLLSDIRVKDATVVAREDSPGNKRLIAYVVPAVEAPHAGGLSVEVLRADLSGHLPEFMIPSAFVLLTQLPLTPNGKVDRRALPAPQAEDFGTRQYESPRGGVESILASLWQELLRVDRVGRHDNFFQLGGHSLLIVQLIDRLGRQGLTATVRSVYESPTLAALASTLAAETVEALRVPPNLIPPGSAIITPDMLPLVSLEPSHIDQIVRAVPGGAENIQDIYPLAPLQEGILFHRLLDEQGTDTYIASTLLSVDSRARASALIQALQAVVDRHDVLRTAIVWDGLPQPLQVVYRQAILPVEEIPLLGDRDPVEQLADRLNRERQTMRLTQAPLMRVQIADAPGASHCYLILQSHHIVGDNTSREFLIAEALAYLEGKGKVLPNSVPYRSHVAQALARAATTDAERFFQRRLGDVIEPTAPFGLLNVHGDGSRIEESHEALDLPFSQRMRALARRQGVTTATVFHAAWALVIAQTSARHDVVFGTVLWGRLEAGHDARRALGMFINTLPLRLNLLGMTVCDLIDQTQRALADLLTHEQASLSSAQRCSAIAGSAPLFTALLNYRHRQDSPESEWGAAAGIRVLMSHDRTNYPITLSVDDLGEAFELTVQTDRRVDPRRVSGYMLTALQSVLDALEREPIASALSLNILPETERYQIVESFNPPHADGSAAELIHERFEQQVVRAPHRVAVVYEGTSLTYEALNRQANQLAQRLNAAGVGPNQLVGLHLERSLEMVVAILGVLKSGGAYVPLDPAYPPERLAYMLTDAAPSVVLTQASLRSRIPTTNALVMSVDADEAGHDQYSTESGESMRARQHPNQLAYVIYTSGSTGAPKGVMVEHAQVTRLFSATESWFRFNEEDVWSLFHSFAFDFSVWELWGALLYGGRVVVVPQATARSPQEFYHLLCQEQVTVLSQTPSAFTQLIEAEAHSAARHSLRFVIFGGEALELRALRRWVQGNGTQHPQLVNMYGITETTVHVTYRSLLAQAIESDATSPVGEPIPDLRVYLLNEYRQPVPIGVCGEIYVSGAGVSRGYLNRPSLTAERFLADPYSPDPHARMYKSGDLGRWRADGTIEYLGRNDQQVKIRGFRIELGEIEAQLEGHVDVKEAVILARDEGEGERRLVAYVIPKDFTMGTLSPRAEVLREHLRTRLPSYMVPSAFVVMSSFPLTTNGKLDRRALPAPDLEAYARGAEEAPRGHLEQRLAQIWQGVLRVERVSREDSFFDLGGHSLLAMQVAVRVRSALSIDMPVKWLFDFPTLKDLSAQLEGRREALLQNALNSGGAEVEELLEVVTSMSDHHVQQLMRELTMEARS